MFRWAVWRPVQPRQRCVLSSRFHLFIFSCLNDLSPRLLAPCLSVMGGAGLSDWLSQSGDEEVLGGSAGWSHQQTDAAHQGQTAAPQNLHGAVEPAEAGAQQGVWPTHTHTNSHIYRLQTSTIIMSEGWWTTFVQSGLWLSWLWNVNSLNFKPGF